MENTKENIHHELTLEYLELLHNSPLDESWHEGFIQAFLTLAISSDQKKAEIKNLKRIINVEEGFLQKYDLLSLDERSNYQNLYQQWYLEIDREDLLIAAKRITKIYKNIDESDISNEEKDRIKREIYLSNPLLIKDFEATAKYNEEDQKEKPSLPVSINEETKISADKEFCLKNESNCAETSTETNEKETPLESSSCKNQEIAEKIIKQFRKSTEGKAVTIMSIAYNTVRHHEKVRTKGEKDIQKRRMGGESEALEKISIEDFAKGPEKNIDALYANLMYSGKSCLYEDSSDRFQLLNSQNQSLSEEDGKKLLTAKLNQIADQLQAKLNLNEELSSAVKERLKSPLDNQESFSSLKPI